MVRQANMAFVFLYEHLFWRISEQTIVTKDNKSLLEYILFLILPPYSNCLQQFISKKYILAFSLIKLLACFPILLQYIHDYHVSFQGISFVVEGDLCILLLLSFKCHTHNITGHSLMCFQHLKKRANWNSWLAEKKAEKAEAVSSRRDHVAGWCLVHVGTDCLA